MKAYDFLKAFEREIAILQYKYTKITGKPLPLNEIEVYVNNKETDIPIGELTVSSDFISSTPKHQVGDVYIEFTQ